MKILDTKKSNSRIAQQSHGGFSTIELLIAFSVGIIFLSSAMMVAFSDPSLTRQVSLENGQTAALDTTLDSTALTNSTNKIGKIVAALVENWNAITNPDTDGFFDNTPTVNDISPCMKEVENTTTWKTLNDRDRLISFGTTLSNVDIALALGPGGCDPLPPSDWEKPDSDPDAEINIAGADNGTGVAIRTVGDTRYAYVTTNPTGNGMNKKEFSIIDVTDIDISHADTATVPATKGLLGLALYGEYAYVLNNDTMNHLKVMRIGTPTNPQYTATAYTLPGITCTYDASVCQSKARSIAYYDGYLYIGTGYMAGNSPEFHIYCVDDSSVPGCSPTTPVHRASLNVNHNINDIDISGNYAYLATSAEYGELTVIDITSKTAPKLPLNYSDPDVNSYKFNAKTTAGNASSEDGTSIYILGKYAYLGRERINNASEREFYVLDISNLDSIKELGSLTTGINSNNSYISGIVVQSKTAFVSTTDSNQSVFIIDIRNSIHPFIRNACSEINTSQAANALIFKDNLVFLAHAQGSSILKIIYDSGNSCS